jgi:hypothetical protein
MGRGLFLIRIEANQDQSTQVEEVHARLKKHLFPHLS